MRITAIALGSRGDVQPVVALGERLQAAGHSVRLATHTLFETLVRSRGLDFFPVEVNPRDVLESEAGQKWLDADSNVLLLLHRFSRIAMPLVRQSMIDCWNASQGTEAILSVALAACVAYPVAEKLRVPFGVISVHPLTPTRTFASPFLPPAPAWFPWGSGYYNHATYLLPVHIFWLLIRPSVNKALGEVLGIPPLSSQCFLNLLLHQATPFFYSYSSTVLPKPPDWRDWHSVGGYWFLDRQADWQPPVDLVDFLASGAPPVCFGFGSMSNHNSEEVTEIVLKALARSRQRGILLTGWGGLSNTDLPDEVFKIDAVPHDWLFPQMAAVVHHGGSGTTAAGLRAGIPSVIVPFFDDQPFWGRRVFELGAGPKPIPRKRLSVERLAAAISAATSDPGMRRRAAALGVGVRAEDGLAQAVAVFDRYMSAKA
jgi:sterol 3beta-glucosyltransferase